MPGELRMSAVTGDSFGARGTASRLRPASCGRRLPFRAFTTLLDHTRLCHASLPPRERGRTWSRLPSSDFSTLPVYWQRLSSRSRIVFAHSFGRFFGTLAEFTATITVGTLLQRKPTGCCMEADMRSLSIRRWCKHQLSQQI